MLGFRRTAVHLALIALLLRAFLPPGWMPAAQGDAPLVICSVNDGNFTGEHPGDGHAIPGKDDPRAHEHCAFAAGPAIAAPINAIFFAPRLKDGDRDDHRPAPVRLQPRRHAPQSPRAPPSSL